jgi:hypothetical protein
LLGITRCANPGKQMLAWNSSPKPRKAHCHKEPGCGARTSPITSGRAASVGLAKEQTDPR